MTDIIPMTGSMWAAAISGGVILAAAVGCCVLWARRRSASRLPDRHEYELDPGRPTDGGRS